MAPRRFDARQTAARDLLQQLFPNLANQELDVLLRSIDAEVTPPLRVEAANPNSRVINIGPAIVSNADAGRNKSIPHIQGGIPGFTSGTVTFPASNGGTILVSPGSNATLTCPNNNYVKVLLSLDATGLIVVTVGSPNPAEASAVVPPNPANTLAFAYITIFNNSGTIQNVAQNKIYQLLMGGATSGGSSSTQSVRLGMADEVAIPDGTDTVSVFFDNAQNDTGYVVFPMVQNTSDASPQSLQVLTVTKTTSGFTVQLNSSTTTPNYRLLYIIPPQVFHIAEAAIPMGASSVSPLFKVADNGAQYGLVATLQNTADSVPQFQPLVITAKSASGFSASWNAPTDSSNYKLAYMRMATEELNLTIGTTSQSFDLPVDCGNLNYAVFACIHNLVDGAPQFQSLTLTAKANASFTISWEDPLDSVNYKLVYYVMPYTQ